MKFERNVEENMEGDEGSIKPRRRSYFHLKRRGRKGEGNNYRTDLR
jgi:hypothetical protein